MAGYTAFRNDFMTTDLLSPEKFSQLEARRLRYGVMFAMYENTAYSDIHRWAASYRSKNGLYKYIRNIYNPSYRIGEFWKASLLGGKLDPDAGDGQAVSSALPILTESEDVRRAIAQLWKWSKWQGKKDVLSLQGAILGDAVIKVVDDTQREKVYLSVVHPSSIKDVELDAWGNVKGYVIEEKRPDPRSSRDDRTCTYLEVAERDETENIQYSTYLDGQLYDWNGQGAKWSEPYGFVPMVMFQHNDVGLEYGWSELYPGLSKFREVDDLASKLSDQIRKAVAAPWLLGMKKPETTPRAKGAAKTDEAPQPGRDEIPMLYAGDGKAASATPLVAPLDIAATAAYIKDILADIEQDYPELSADLHNVQGDISGRALRINRAPAEKKVLQRRPNYDAAVAQAQMMALAIGGMRGYQNFETFSLDSFAQGALDHSIGDRPVFARDPLDDLEEEKMFWTVGVQAKSFGVPPLEWLRANGEKYGYDEDRIAKIEASPEYRARMAALEASTQAVKAGTLPGSNNGGK